MARNRYSYDLGEAVRLFCDERYSSSELASHFGYPNNEKAAKAIYMAVKNEMKRTERKRKERSEVSSRLNEEAREEEVGAGGYLLKIPAEKNLTVSEALQRLAEIGNLIKTVVDELGSGTEVEIKGFGVFFVREKERTT